MSEKNKKELQKEYGRVWTPKELQEEFEVLEFGVPFIIVRRKKDGVKGSLMFQHTPRFYFHFVKEE